jgi:hypothetical protein
MATRPSRSNLVLPQTAVLFAFVLLLLLRGIVPVTNAGAVYRAAGTTGPAPTGSTRDSLAAARGGDAGGGLADSAPASGAAGGGGAGAAGGVMPHLTIAGIHVCSAQGAGSPRVPRRRGAAAAGRPRHVRARPKDQCS